MTITLPTDAELSDAARATLATVPPLNVFRMMARAPASLAPFIQLARSILTGSELPPRVREVAVLRVAHLAGSSYAFQQHVQLGKLVGLSEADIAATAGGSIEGLDEISRMACRVAEEITQNVRLSDETLADTVALLGERQVAELILCCSYFNMVARFLESTRVPLDLIGGKS
jgi:alkylhydroperoxidase family enzyme